jgi:recombinational DNA repair protein (RecF pathway)
MGAAKDNKKAKDQAMAAMMKRLGIKRTVLRCPICNKEIAISAAYVHIGFHTV